MQSFFCVTESSTATTAAAAAAAEVIDVFYRTDNTKNGFYFILTHYDGDATRTMTNNWTNFLKHRFYEFESRIRSRILLAGTLTWATAFQQNIQSQVTTRNDDGSL